MKNKKPWSFCETPKEKCIMNYCDENGCQNRKRNLVNEEQLKRHQVHMLPTEDEMPYNIIKYISGKLEYLLPGEIGYIKEKVSNQHLYFTTDEEPKVGDYAYQKVFGLGKIEMIHGEECFVTIKMHENDGSFTTPWRRNVPDTKKIIATTDPKLTVEQSLEGIKGKVPFSLPQPTEAFIKAYCEQGGIDEVEVEYDVMDISTLTSNTDDYPNLDIVTIKVDPIHNTVITHLIEEKMIPLSKVKELIEKHSDFIDSQIDYDGIASACCSIGMPEWDDEKWIKENL